MTTLTIFMAGPCSKVEYEDFIADVPYYLNYAHACGGLYLKCKDAKDMVLIPASLYEKLVAMKEKAEKANEGI